MPHFRIYFLVVVATLISTLARELPEASVAEVSNQWEEHSLEQSAAVGTDDSTIAIRSYIGRLTLHPSQPPDKSTSHILRVEDGNYTGSGFHDLLLLFAPGGHPGHVANGSIIHVLGQAQPASPNILVVIAPIEILFEPGDAPGGPSDGAGQVPTSRALRRPPYPPRPRRPPPPPRRRSPPPPRWTSPPPPPSRPLSTPSASLTGRTYRIRSLTYILNYCGHTSDMTVDFLKQRYGYSGDPNSMTSYMSQISHGALAFLPQDNLIVGPINVPCSGVTRSGSPYNAASCDDQAPWGWQEAADQVAKQMYGIEPSQFPHRIMMLASNPQCPWVGLGTESCVPNACSVWMNRGATYFSLDQLAHELGHNLGMYHSAMGPDTYGDHSCVMGSWQGLRSYNAPVSWSAGFATTVPGGDLSSASQLPAGTWVSYAIPALSTATAAMLRLSTAVTGTRDTYFASFRAPVGMDVGLPPVAQNKVQVHTYNGGQAFGTRQQTWLQANLGAGQYWPASSTQPPTINLGARQPVPHFVITVDTLDTGSNIAHVRVCRWQSQQTECRL